MKKDTQKCKNLYGLHFIYDWFEKFEPLKKFPATLYLSHYISMNKTNLMLVSLQTRKTNIKQTSNLPCHQKRSIVRNTIEMTHY